MFGVPGHLGLVVVHYFKGLLGFVLDEERLESFAEVAYLPKQITMLSSRSEYRSPSTQEKSLPIIRAVEPHQHFVGL